MDKRDPNPVLCSQFEAMLSDALDGLLTEDDKRAFEAHSRICLVCGPLFAETRQGLLWLRSLEEVEPPANLVHNILAATSAGDQRHSQADPAMKKAARRKRWWNSVVPVLTGAVQPRFVTSFAMAFFSLSLTLTLGGVRLKDIASIDWRPGSLMRAAQIQYNHAESRVVKYYENMRFVYEIESRVRELRKAADSAPADEQKQEEPKPGKNRNDNNDTSGRPDERQDLYSREQGHPVVPDAKNIHEGA